MRGIQNRGSHRYFWVRLQRARGDAFNLGHEATERAFPQDPLHDVRVPFSPLTLIRD